MERRKYVSTKTKLFIVIASVRYSTTLFAIATIAFPPCFYKQTVSLFVDFSTKREGKGKDSASISIYWPTSALGPFYLRKGAQKGEPLLLSLQTLPVVDLLWKEV